MAFTQRYLKPASLCLLSLSVALVLRAQQPLEKPVTFRAMAVGNSVSALLYELAPGKIVPLSAGSSDLSQPYASPPGGLVAFFREGPPERPGEKPKRIPIAKAQLGSGGPYLVVLSLPPTGSNGMSVETIVVDDSWTAHPMKTVRVFNFSKRRAALQVGADNQELVTGGSHVFPYPPGKGSILFKVALMEEQGWVLRTNCPQGIIPNTRSTVIITDVVPTVDEPNPVDINVANVFDFSQPPPVDQSPNYGASKKGASYR